VHAQQPAPLQGGEGRPRLEVADVFRAHGEAYRQSHALTSQQLKVMRAIEACRTSVLGGHLDLCTACGHSTPAYNSCRNRHCPKCQSLRQAQWIAERKRRILPTHYFHVVFTVPQQLKPLAMRNRKRFFDLLFTTVAQTLLTLGADEKRLGGMLGVTAVLHTWTRELKFHPHLHCIVTGGGLSADDARWLSAKRRFLFPVKVLSRLFRGKLLDALRRLVKRRQLELGGIDFARIAKALHCKEWVVYSKTPFGGPEQVVSYLGRYTHRVGLSNHRLLHFDQEGVSFLTKNGSSVTLPPDEFIRRFLLHVLPNGFVKIRHFGLMAASNATTRLEVARRLLKPTQPPASAVPLDWRQLLQQLTGIDLFRCPVCGQRTMTRLPLPKLDSS